MNTKKGSSDGFRLAPQKPSTTKGDAFKLTVVGYGQPLKRGFYLVEIISAVTGLSKKNKPMITIKLDARNEDNAGEISAWIGDWCLPLYANLCLMAGRTLQDGIASVAELVGVTGYAFIEETEFNCQPSATVKNLITREQMEAGGFPIPFASATPETDFEDDRFVVKDDGLIEEVA